MGKATEKALKNALTQAVLSLKVLAEPEILPPPDATVCKLIAKGALMRVSLALDPSLRTGVLKDLLSIYP